MSSSYQPSSFLACVSYVWLILVARLTNGSLKHRHDAARAERRGGKSVRNTKGIVYACIYLLWAKPSGSLVWFFGGARDFSLLQSVQTGSQTPSETSSPRDKAAAEWRWSLTPASAEIKNMCSYTCTLPFAYHDVHRDNFAFTYMKPKRGSLGLWLVRNSLMWNLIC